jgi:hypothetical protein
VRDFENPLDSIEPASTEPEPEPNPFPYWASLAEDELGTKLWTKVEDYSQESITKAVSTRQTLAYRYYFGTDADGIHATSQVLRAGEQGELATIRVNHSRPLVNTLLNLIVAPKIVWSPKAVNVDYDSLRQTKLAQAVLEYYWSEKRVSSYTVRALEEALVLSESYVLLLWDEYGGEDNIPDENGQMLKSGDICLRGVLPWDVYRDPTKGSYDDLDWVVVRVRKNKYDLMKSNPGKAEQIMQASGEAENQRSSLTKKGDEDTDDVDCFYFFHRRTPALPGGREAMFLSGDCVLYADDLSYNEIPLYRVSAGEQFGTP